MRQDTWETLPRDVKLSYVLYPSLAPEWARREMRIMAANEGKRSAVEVRGGIEKPTKQRR